MYSIINVIKTSKKIQNKHIFKKINSKKFKIFQKAVDIYEIKW